MKNIRYAFINRQILRIYSALPAIKFPIDIKDIIDLIPNCKYMSYQEFAKLNECSVRDVINLCESKSGCTHYDVATNKYLILCNHSTANNNNIGRQRWTGSHELGHIVCNHHELLAYSKLAENNINNNANSQYEAEADYFAATLLAPFPLFKILKIQSATDIQKVFGLSVEASVYCYEKYLKWNKYHRKTAWENDIVNLYLNKVSL